MDIIEDELCKILKLYPTIFSSSCLCNMCVCVHLYGLCIFILYVFVLVVTNSLGFAANSHLATGTDFFCEYNRPSMISLSNACICISWERVQKKSSMINLPAFRRVKEIDAG